MMLIFTGRYPPASASASHGISTLGTCFLTKSINGEAAGAPSIKPTMPTRGIPKAVLNLFSAPFGKITNLIS